MMKKVCQGTVTDLGKYFLDNELVDDQPWVWSRKGEDRSVHLLSFNILPVERPTKILKLRAVTKNFQDFVEITVSKTSMAVELAVHYVNNSPEDLLSTTKGRDNDTTTVNGRS